MTTRTSSTYTGPTTFTGTRSPPRRDGPGVVVLEPARVGSDPVAIARDQIAGRMEPDPAAVEQTRRELRDSALSIESSSTAALAGIFRAHGMMLDGIRLIRQDRAGA